MRLMMICISGNRKKYSTSITSNSSMNITLINSNSIFSGNAITDQGGIITADYNVLAVIHLVTICRRSGRNHVRSQMVFHRRNRSYIPIRLLNIFVVVAVVTAAVAIFVAARRGSRSHINIREYGIASHAVVNAVTVAHFSCFSSAVIVVVIVVLECFCFRRKIVLARTS